MVKDFWVLKRFSSYFSQRKLPNSYLPSSQFDNKNKLTYSTRQKRAIEITANSIYVSKFSVLIIFTFNNPEKNEVILIRFFYFCLYTSLFKFIIHDRSNNYCFKITNLFTVVHIVIHNKMIWFILFVHFINQQLASAVTTTTNYKRKLWNLINKFIVCENV